MFRFLFFTFTRPRKLKGRSVRFFKAHTKFLLFNDRFQSFKEIFLPPLPPLFSHFLSSFFTDLGWKWHYLFIQGILLPLLLNKWHILIHLCKPSNLISYHIIEKMRKGRIGNWISQMGTKKSSKIHHKGIICLFIVYLHKLSHI